MKNSSSLKTRRVLVYFTFFSLSLLLHSSAFAPPHYRPTYYDEIYDGDLNEDDDFDDPFNRYPSYHDPYSLGSSRPIPINNYRPSRRPNPASKKPPRPNPSYDDYSDDDTGGYDDLDFSATTTGNTSGNTNGGTGTPTGETEAAPIPTVSLQDIWDQELGYIKSPQTYPDKQALADDLVQILKTKTFVFSEGIALEIAKVGRSCFDEYETLLNLLGVSHRKFSYASNQGTLASSANLTRDLESIYAVEKKPIVLFAHSKAGAGALDAILNKPSLLKDGIVDRVVIFQGAILGTPMAEQKNFGTLSRLMIKGALGEGISSLEPASARKLMERAYCNFQKRLTESMPNTSEEEIEKEKQRLSDRVFYIQSSNTAPGYSSIIHSILLFYNKEGIHHASSHDVLVPTSHQIHPAFGRTMGTVASDHTELVVTGLRSRASTETRLALGRALFRALYSQPGFKSESLLDKSRINCAKF